MKQCAISHRVLVVDDSRDVADMLVEVFTQHGHQASAAYSGAQGLAAIDAFAPDVVFMDLSMPDMSGFEVAATLRDKGPREFALIAFSSMAGVAVTNMAAATGFDRHMVKTAEFGQLLDALDTRPGMAAGRHSPGAGW
jgi:CheY-like chemotaxis protein